MIPTAPPLVLAAVLAASPAPGPAPGHAASPAASTARADVERLEAWPELSGGERSDVKKDVKRLRKASTDEMGEQAAEALVAVGAAVVPHLLPALGKEDDDGALARIDEVLLEVTDARHTRCLSEFFEDRAIEVRVWALRRAARFPDPGLNDVALARLHAVVGTPDDPPPKEPDPDEAYATALLAVSTGSLEGLDLVFDAARAAWSERGDEILAATAAVRGPDASAAACARIGDDRKDTVAGLRLLWACGDESAVPAIRRLLDLEDPTVRAAAINALRCIVDGDEPLDRLPVFEGIERAKKWKERLR